MKSIFLFIILIVVITTSASPPITVFIIPHAHCDVGFVKTVDEYYNTEVRNILDTVTENLLQNPSYRFQWVETNWIYFYLREDPSRIDKLVKLVNNGQLELLGGGWTMNDEAVVHARHAIDQMTLGHDLLVDLFGEKMCPKYGWQIDPFGSSSFTTQMFSLMGFNAQVYRRVDYSIEDKWRVDKLMQFVWNPSHSLPNSDVENLVHILDFGYSSPLGFDFEHGGKQITPENVKSRSDDLHFQLSVRSKQYRTPLFLMTFGGDFEFQNATLEYSNMDKLIEYINDNPHQYSNMTLRYATVSEYFEALHASFANDTEFPYHSPDSGDLFPYEWMPDSYWSGFFTTRPFIKQRVRQVNAMLRAVEQQFVLLGRWNDIHFSPDLYTDHLIYARQNMSILSHHDAVTGTCRNDVYADYLKRIDESQGEIHHVSSQIMQLALPRHSPRDHSFQITADNSTIQSLFDTPNVNIPVILWNSLAWNRINEPIRLYVANHPPSVGQGITILDDQGNKLPCQIIPDGDIGFYMATTIPIIPRMGFNTIHLSWRPVGALAHDSNQIHDSSWTLSNDKFDFNFQPNTGILQSIHNKHSELSINVNLDILEYHSERGGAYIFRVKDDTQHPFVDTKPVATLSSGDVVQQISQSFGETLQITYRLYTHSEFLEIDVRVGPPNADTDIVMLLTTSLDNKAGEFFTDDSGIQIQKRSYVSEKLKPGNFYPLVSNIFIESSSARLSVATAQTHGATSRHSGEIEIMLHRRFSQVDKPDPGTHQAMNDTSVVTERFHLSLDATNGEADTWRHRHTLSLNEPVQPLFAITSMDWQTWNQTCVSQFSGISQTIPPNVDILTVQARNDNEKDGVYVRFHHMFAKWETAANLSQPIVLPEINEIFNIPSTRQPQERTLSMLYPISEMQQRFKWKHQQSLQSLEAAPSTDDDQDKIVLQPTQIRSFWIR